MRLKSWDPQKAHWRHLLNVHTKFQLPSPIWRGVRRGTALFWGQKWGKTHISPPNWLRGSIFGYVIQLQIIYQLAKKGQFLRLWPLSTSSTKLGHDRILTPKSWTSQKAHLGLLLNIHNKFQLPSSIWRGVLRGTNSRNDGNEKTRPKKPLL